MYLNSPTFRRYLSFISALFISVLISSSLLFIAYQVYAGTPFGGDSDSSLPDPDDGNPDPDDGTPDPDDGPPVQIDFNPTRYDSICKVLDALLSIVTQVGAIVGALLVIFSGFLFVKAQGNREGINQAKKTLYTTLVGVAIILGASVIARIILRTVSNVLGADFGSCF